MDDLKYLTEIQANYGHNIADYRWIGLGKGTKFNEIKWEYDHVNEIYSLGPNKDLGLPATRILGARFKWTEDQRRNLLYTTRRHSYPRTPLLVSVISHTHNSIICDRLGTFELMRPISCNLKHGYLVKAGKKTRQNFYFAFPMCKSALSATEEFKGVQAHSGAFRHVQEPNGNTQAGQGSPN